MGCRVCKWQNQNMERLNQAVPNTHIKWIGDYVKTVCAIINAFRPPLTSNSNDDIALANVLKTISSRSNGLKRKVFQVNKQFGVKCLQNVFSFPCLNENDLRALTLGVYQIKQAKA